MARPVGVENKSTGCEDTLVRYNVEDLVNLQYLADVAYNEALAKLPIRVEPLVARSKHAVGTPFELTGFFT